MSEPKAASSGAIWSAMWIVYIVWGSTYLGIALAVESMPPSLALGLRFLVAGTAMATFVGIRQGWSALHVSGRQVAGAMLVGAMLLGIANGNIALAVAYVPSGVCALLVAVNPLWIVMLRAATGDRPKRVTLLGVFIGLVGVAVLVLPGSHVASVGGASPLQRTFWSLVIVAGSFTALLLVHHLIYGVWMQPDVVIEYILHVPGPLPIDPLSDFLFLAAAMALAGWTVLREQGDRRALIVATLLFAASSYYLGRSHPNNICNLMPFVVLVALRARPSPLVRLGIATSIAAITLSYWTYVPFGIDRADPVEVRIAKLDPGMNEIRSHIANPDRLGIADIGQSLNRHPDESLVWTPMDPYSLWSFVPSERRRLYIRRSAQRLRRSGWVILQGDAAKLLSEFEAGYNVAELSRTGEYTVAKLIPKP